MPQLEKLESKDPKVKYGYAKELTLMATAEPLLLLPYYSDWIRLLHHPNNIIKWTAIDIVGLLSEVDMEGTTLTALPTIIELLHSGKLITSGHAIGALCLIAKNNPSLTNGLIAELLTVTNDEYDTIECSNIAVGHVLKGLMHLTPYIAHNASVHKFIKHALINSRNATRTKAIKLLKKMGRAVDDLNLD